MEFQKVYIYKTAIDYARQGNHQEIIDLLTRGPRLS